MAKLRPYILSIAGYDPSGGAGLLADIKTFEQHKVMGLGVMTANTIQNENTFESLEWQKLDTIIGQIEILKQYPFQYVKIGIMKSIDVLEQIIDFLITLNENVKIIWDPVLYASAGFQFMDEINLDRLYSICGKVYCITPNKIELKKLSEDIDIEKFISKIASSCVLYLKGGHDERNKGKDYIYINDKVYPLNPILSKVYDKHGSGCILSSSLAANLTLGFPLIKASLKAKAYTESALASNTSHLSYHKY